MNTTTACCPAPMTMTSQALARPTTPSTARWRTLFQRAWQAWRERQQREAEWRTLAKLDERTRRDIGLAERSPPGAGLPWDLERGRW